MNMEQALQIFFDESHDLLDEMERILLASKDSLTSKDDLDALFRTIHTIKGSAGLFAMDSIVHFTHQVENLLDLLRTGTLTLEPALVIVLLHCHDHVQALLAEANAGPAVPPDDGEVLLQALAAWHTPAVPTSPPAVLPIAASNDGPARYFLSLHFSRDLLRNGMDPASFLRYLQTLGTIEGIRTLYCSLPAADAFDPESLYLRFALVFAGPVSLTTLQDAFEFAQADSQIVICPLAQAGEQLARLTSQLAADEIKAVTQAWQELGVCLPTITDQAAAPLEPAIRVPATTESKFIKVEAFKLDKLIDLIGELVIAGAAASLVAQRSGQPQMAEATQSMAALVEQIRAGTLSMRMVQIGEIFQRFSRVIHDVSQSLGKSIALHIAGAETELDKSMVDKLGDPLMHIVRNAIDHGIEPAETRLACGKPVTGNLWLNAWHESGSIVIEVADDGGGLDTRRILAKAIERGLLPADAQPDEAEIFQLIFEPGFSTASRVSNLSGRGVGMDVVRNSIEQLRGAIDIDSQWQQGTTFRIRLPLTLAIIDGFLVQTGDAIFVLPLETVIECIELPAGQHATGHAQLDLRGDMLPLLHLGNFFSLPARPTVRQNVVVVRFGDHKAGLVIDALLGEFQTVIKPLGSLFRHLKAVSGSTILGSGEVALILDVNALIRVATLKESQLYSLTTREGQ